MLIPLHLCILLFLSFFMDVQFASSKIDMENGKRRWNELFFFLAAFHHNLARYREPPRDSSDKQEVTTHGLQRPTTRPTRIEFDGAIKRS